MWQVNEWKKNKCDWIILAAVYTLLDKNFLLTRHIGVTVAADLFPYGIQTETVWKFRSHFVLWKRFCAFKTPIFWLQSHDSSSKWLFKRQLIHLISSIRKSQNEKKN